MCKQANVLYGAIIMTKYFFHTLQCDLRRSLFSCKFLLAVIGYVLVTLLTMFDELTFFQSETTSLLYIWAIFDSLDFRIIYLVFAAVPGTLLFCSDWENRYIRFSVMRSFKRTYGLSKGVSCFLSAASVVAAGQCLLLALFGLFFPPWNSRNMVSLGVYESLNTPDALWLYFFFVILCKAFCAGFLCVFALWISTCIINPLVTLATPILTFYILNMAAAFLHLPAFLCVGILSDGNLYINGNPVLSFLASIGILCAATILFGGLFVKNCVRRIENG